MRGTGPVSVNGDTVYAYYTQDNSSVRVRMSVDEADRLGIVEGLRLRIALPGRSAGDYLAIAANRTPPYVWLHLEPLAPVALRSMGAPRSKG
jgi:hypothetical protein